MVELRERGEEIRQRLVERGLFVEPQKHEVNLDDGLITYGEGFPITAIEKFLGYYDKEINIANFPSISFNTDFSVAKTACLYTEEAGADSVILDGETNRKYDDRAGKAMNYFKDRFGIRGSFKFYIRREKRYDDAKGLGESAAVAASTGRALVSNVFGMDAVKDDVFVSTLARLVSGSGTRSAMNGFSLWFSYPEVRESMCHGVKLPVDYSNFNFLTLPAVHEIKTAGAHDIAKSSPYYPRWMINKFGRILEIIDSNYSLEVMMRHAEEDMYLMHSLLMSKGTIIHTPDSLGAINSLREFSKKNEGIYHTADTGPSLVLMSEDRHLLKEFVDESGKKPLWGKIQSTYETRPDTVFMKEAEEYLSH